MITHRENRRPKNWGALMADLEPRWTVPFKVFEWFWEWVAYGLSRWSFLEVLEYLGSFSVLIGVIFYFSESGDRIKQRHYQAWQVINTAQGKGGSGGRIEALQELNEDKVQLVGVDVSSAFLQGIRLERANLLRADLSAADIRGGDLRDADLSYADLHSANLRGSHLENASLIEADLRDADFVGADLAHVNLNGANLISADLRSANLDQIEWRKIKSIAKANIAGVRAAPEGFLQWALANGAVDSSAGEN